MSPTLRLSPGNRPKALKRTNRRTSFAHKQPGAVNPRAIEPAFKEYIFAHRMLILVGALVTAALFVLVKLVFPYPDFFLDSYAYVADAAFNRTITYRPVGYATFLKAIHMFSGGPGIVVFTQYLFYFFSSTFIFLSCDFLFGFPGKVKKMVYFLVVINPILLLQTNLISSDSLFCSATVIWFGSCLWCVMRPTWYSLAAQVILIFCCFHLRYTAMYYPGIAIIYFLISRGSFFYKVAGIGLTTLVIYFAVESRKDVMEAGTGVRILTAFSGWQIANNVLCYYKDIKVNPDDLPSGEARQIDAFVRTYIDTLYKKNRHSVGTHFLWTKTSPLKYYQISRMNRDKTTYGQEWIVSSQYLSEYGWSIVKNNPLAYVRYYMGRNLKHYFVPYLEILGNYDVNHEQLPPETKAWFGFSVDYLETDFPNLQKWISYPYPAFVFVVNVANILLLLVMLFMSIRYRRFVSTTDLKFLIAWGVFYLSFMGFCLFSTVVLLRYVDVLLILGVIMPFVSWQSIRRVLLASRAAGK